VEESCGFRVCEEGLKNLDWEMGMERGMKDEGWRVKNEGILIAVDLFDDDLCDFLF